MFSSVAVVGKGTEKDIIGALATWADINFIPADSRLVGKILKEDLGSALSNEQYILCVFPLVQNIVCDGKADISFGTMLCYYYVTCIIHLN